MSSCEPHEECMSGVLAVKGEIFVVKVEDQFLSFEAKLLV